MEDKADFYKKNILILGGGGYIGLHVTKMLTNLGYEPTVLTTNAKEISSLDFIKKTKLISGLITDKKLLEDLVADNEVVINLVGIKDRNNLNPKKSIEINCIGELNVLESISKFNSTTHHIFIGTREQFGKIGKNGKLIDEMQAQKPRSFYGIHKQLCEQYLEAYQNLKKLNITSLRLVGVYGPSLIGEPKHFTNTLINNALEDRDLVIRGDGSQIQDFIYIDDVVDIIQKTIFQEPKGIYNVGSGKGLSMKNLAFMINKKCGGKGKVIFKEMNGEEDYFDIDGCIMNIQKIKKETGWTPKTDIYSGIDKTINWTKNKRMERRYE